MSSHRCRNDVMCLLGICPPPQYSTPCPPPPQYSKPSYAYALLGCLVNLNARNKSVTAELLKQGYRYHKLRKAFPKFYRRHFELVSTYNTGLRSVLQKGLSEPELYGDFVYKFRKIVGIAELSDQFKKIVMRYKRIGYNEDVMRQSACFVVNPIRVNNFAVLFNCMPVGRGSDHMIAPT